MSHQHPSLVTWLHLCHLITGLYLWLVAMSHHHMTTISEAIFFAVSRMDLFNNHVICLTTTMIHFTIVLNNVHKIESGHMVTKLMTTTIYNWNSRLHCGSKSKITCTENCTCSRQGQLNQPISLLNLGKWKNHSVHSTGIYNFVRSSLS